MALWCQGFPAYTAPYSDRPKALTVVLPYYENGKFLSKQLNRYSVLPASVRPHVSLIVVDDGSPEHPARRVVWDIGIPMSVYRIGVDVRWNWLAARNIGAYHAATEWLLMTDMDHMVPDDTIQRVIHGYHDPAAVYAFNRREHTGERLAPHSASFLMRRELYWRIGGYDETLSGYYGTDGDYRRRVASVAKIHVLSDDLERHEYVDDSSTTRYLRKQPEDAAVRKMVAKRRPGWQPKTLSFPYQLVYQSGF